MGVLGHIEWVQFARVPEVPRAGEVMHATDVFEEPEPMLRELRELLPCKTPVGASRPPRAGARDELL